MFLSKRFSDLKTMFFVKSNGCFIFLISDKVYHFNIPFFSLLHHKMQRFGAKAMSPVLFKQVHFAQRHSVFSVEVNAKVANGAEISFQQVIEGVPIYYLLFYDWSFLVFIKEE